MHNQPITGIYLAAGKSLRFGDNKLIPQVQNKPLGSLALTTAIESKLDKIVVVTSESDRLQWVSPQLFHCYQERWLQVACLKSTEGQSESLKCGLTFAKKLRSDAVMVILADQPFITVEMINKLINHYKRHIIDNMPISFVAATHSGIPCPPILFSKKMFNELDRIQGDMGARFLIQNKYNDGYYVEFTDPKLFFDIDTKADLTQLSKGQDPITPPFKL